MQRHDDMFKFNDESSVNQYYVLLFPTKSINNTYIRPTISSHIQLYV